MPSGPRRQVFDASVPGVYHCYNQSVRQLFLLNGKASPNQKLGIRQSWIRDLESTLAGLFAIEVAFQVTMGNHLHVVLRNRPDVAKRWTDDDVVRRWLMIAKIKRRGENTVDEPTEEQIASEKQLDGRTQELRKRLSDISWFMGALCENISRRVNREDDTRGTNWADRFGCRRLFDESAILVCGMYVDLNPIRAGIAATPEESQFTSVYDRIAGMKMTHSESGSVTPLSKGAGKDRADAWLCPLTIDETLSVDAECHFSSGSGRRASDKGLLPMVFSQYLELLDWTGRQLHSKKRGSIPESLAPILQRLGIQQESWVETVSEFHSCFGRFVGASKTVEQQSGRKRFRGQKQCDRAMTAPPQPN